MCVCVCLYSFVHLFTYTLQLWGILASQSCYTGPWHCGGGLLTRDWVVASGAPLHTQIPPATLREGKECGG